MSTNSKGKDFENFCCKQLDEQGWHIAFKSIRVRFGAVDFDGIWDIVAMKRVEYLLAGTPIPSQAEVSWLFVQCKSRKLYGKELEPFIKWIHTYGIAGNSFFLAVKTKVKRKTAIQWIKLG